MLSTRVTDQELIAAARELPGAPRVLIELGLLIRDPDTDARDVTALLKQDPSLAARLIRIANSAAYARATPAASTEEAVGCIGFTEVHRVVGALAATQMAERNLEHYRLDGARLRRISLFTAVMMEELAVPANESRRACYTVGLLRSVGIMALEVLARNRRIPPYDPGVGQPIDEWEKIHWGIDNCEAAEIILKEWRLPHETVQAIRHHYRPQGLTPPVVHLLSLAAGAAFDRYHGVPGEECYWDATDENFRKAGLTLRDFQAAGERAQRAFDRLDLASA